MRYAKAIALAVATCVLALPMQAAVAAPSITPVMTGLDNPRGLAFSPWGALYVVEAGRGGAGPCFMLRGQLVCYGPTGAVSRLWFGHQKRVAEGLPSLSGPDFADVGGPQDISFTWGGNAYVTVGFGSDPALRSEFGPVIGAQLGSLVKLRPSGRWQVVADVSANESTNNPAGGPIDSNPYGVLALPGRVFVADAGANALLKVRPGGEVSTFATFRSRPQDSTDSVPTSVVLGPDGAFYVGELTGAPFIDGQARIYRVAWDGSYSVFADGFKTIIDLAFGPDGSLYVLQHATGPLFFSGPGEIIRIARDGTRTVVVGGLERPTSLVVGWHGVIYVSNRGTSVLTGEVLRIVP